MKEIDLPRLVMEEVTRRGQDEMEISAELILSSSLGEAVLPFGGVSLCRSEKHITAR